METQAMFDEPSEEARRHSVRASQREFLALQKPIERVLAPDLRSAEGLDELEKALHAIPDDLGAKIESARAEALEAIKLEREERRSGNRRAKSAYIDGLRASGTPTREIDGDNWRVGRLQLVFDPQRAVLTIKYNDEKVLGDLPVVDASDVERHVGAANKMLDDRMLPSDVLIQAMSDAYDYLIRQSEKPDTQVSLRDLHAELRVAALRLALAKRPASKVAPRDMPVWAFLHNLDQYRALGSQVPAKQRLGFETGSQSDTGRFGMTLGGLSPEQAYRVFCFVKRAAG